MRRIGHIPALDGVRGLAVLLVIVSHITEPFSGTGKLAAGFHMATSYGWAGVDLFFVLSGFLISSILLGAEKNSKSLKHFYLRRVCRIFPLYYAVLFLFFWVAPVVFPESVKEYAGLRAHQAWFWSYLGNFLYLKVGGLSILAHIWSLSVEDHFYIVWPLLVFLVPKERFRALCLAMIGIAWASRFGFYFAGLNFDSLGLLTPCRLDSFVVGGLLAKDYLDGKSYFRSALRPGAIALGVLIVLSVPLGRMFPEVATVRSLLNRSILAVLFAWLISGALNEGTLSRKFFEFPGLRALGKYCYGIYLLHPFILKIVNSVFDVQSFNQKLGYVPWCVLYLVIMVPVCFGVAFVSWHLFEKWCLKLVPSQVAAAAGKEETQPVMRRVA